MSTNGVNALMDNKRVKKHSDTVTARRSTTVTATLPPRNVQIH